VTVTVTVGPLDYLGLSRLQLLALSAGLSEFELRDYLKAEISRRRLAMNPQKHARVEYTCSECGNAYDVSESRSGAMAADGYTPLCRLCRFGPAEAERRWVERIPEHALAGLAAAVAAVRP
jgi:hypothetical protein